VVWTRNGTTVGDGYLYHFSALNLVDGIGFYDPRSGKPIAGHPPAWELVLAVPSALGLRSWLSHKLFASRIGAATIAMTGLAGRAAFGRRIGLVAAALAAVYPFMWLYERAILSEPLAMLGVATTIWLTYTFRARPGLALAVALGAIVGFIAMTRAELILISVLVVVPVILSARAVRAQRRIGWLAAAGAACLLVVTPWGIYNTTRFERPVPFSTAAGIGLLQGNCAPTYHGELLGWYQLGCAVFVKDLDPDYSVADGQYRDAGVEFIRDNASRAPVVAAARVGRAFGVFRPTQQMHLEAAESGSPLWVLRLGFVTYWILLLFAVGGFVVARRRSVPVYPLLAFPLVTLLFVLPTIGSMRYRAPAEISLVLLAAVGVEAAVRSWRARLARPAPADVSTL
jgi:4-amino-4-deoxy-L-arabinose transferase-like glycosyltransferase